MQKFCEVWKAFKETVLRRKSIFKTRINQKEQFVDLICSCWIWCSTDGRASTTFRAFRSSGWSSTPGAKSSTLPQTLLPSWKAWQWHWGDLQSVRLTVSSVEFPSHHHCKHCRMLLWPPESFDICWKHFEADWKSCSMASPNSSHIRGFCISHCQSCSLLDLLPPVSCLWSPTG